MAKRDTLTLLNELENFGLKEPLFRDLHHFRGRLTEFRRFCETVSYFRKNGCNQLLHERLDYILQHCKQGALNQGETLESLATVAIRQVPLLRFNGCKKHLLDS
jgi:hypothetical protein